MTDTSMSNKGPSSKYEKCKKYKKICIMIVLVVALATILSCIIPIYRSSLYDRIKKNDRYTHLKKKFSTK